YNPDLAKWLHRIDIPTLILWGDQDKIFPAEYATAFKELIPHAQIEILNQCGHVPHMDRPDEFYPRLKSFLSEGAS
ncbi:MAG: alpha/beta hydrolase, partial [Rhodospirillales bacterium]|nr:alpha/beta hydrolase [Rhodospirillales bacterium]